MHGRADDDDAVQAANLAPRRAESPGAVPEAPPLGHCEHAMPAPRVRVRPGLLKRRERALDFLPQYLRQILRVIDVEADPARPADV